MMRTALWLLLCLSCNGVALVTLCISPVNGAKQERLKRNEEENSLQIFFQEIDKRSKIARLRPLKSITFPAEDLEVRVWIGFGMIPIEGLIIKRVAGEWSALRLRSISPHLSKHDYEQVLFPPHSGWEELWKKLQGEGILTLPDSSQMPDELLAPDGESFVVEIRLGKSYRAYSYNNPHLQRWPEAKHMIKIAKTLIAELDINRRLLGDR